VKRIKWILVALLAIVACGVAVLTITVNSGHSTGEPGSSGVGTRRTMLNQYGEIFGMLEWTVPPDGKTATATLTKVRFSSYGKAGDQPRMVTETNRFAVDEDHGGVVIRELSGAGKRVVNGRFTDGGNSLTVDRSIGGIEPKEWSRGSEVEFHQTTRKFQETHLLKPCPEDPGTQFACG
jgi:hypothetical protein